MKFRVLILSPDKTWGQERVVLLANAGLEVDFAFEGKEGQILLSKNNYQYVFIDLEITNHSCFEVLRFIQSRITGILTFVLARNNKLLEEMAVTENVTKKFSIKKVLIEPTDHKMLEAIKEIGKIKKWEGNGQAAINIIAEGVETNIVDTEFTRIKIEELLFDSIAIFDFYIRLGANRYVKIVHKGEKPIIDQIKKYAGSGTGYLYFLTKERGDFISYQNAITSKMINDSSLETAKIVKTLKTVADKYIEEVYVEGLQPKLVEEGKTLCQNMFNLTQRDSDLKKLMGSLEEFSPTAYTHSFLVCFFCTIICKNLNWVGSATLEALSIGALFHDIGLIQLPDGIKHKDVSLLSEDEFLIFSQHPNLGRETLNGMNSVTNMTREIVLQHHETIDGKGFPFGLSGLKIYPLAKIIGLADTFSELLMEKGISPRDGIKEFLAMRDNLVKYDSDLVKSLVKGFISNK